MFEIIRSLYTCLKTTIVNNGEKSDAFYCQLGVRQGECLSPFLFAMYINDMEEKLSNEGAGVKIEDMRILLLFYADDCVIFSETPQGLQREIDSLFEYCSKWKLKLNTEKSVIVVFRKGNRNVNFNWNFGGVPLTVCNKVKYLGSVFKE